jgi:formylglycine-generating enzyme required for sulfatase activity
MNIINRRNFFKKTLVAGVTSFVSIKSLEAFATANIDLPFDDESLEKSNLIHAPDDPMQWQSWRKELAQWKKKKQDQLNYDGSSYRSKNFEWVTSTFSCGFIMMCDQEFYDYQKNEYTIDHLIEEGKLRYGGYDSIVLWHAYPRIGLDDKNQFDFYRDMPHGLNGLNKVVKQFHKKNVKVFINYKPWDTGTRREPKPDIEMLIDIIKAIDADGIFLDTMSDAPEFREKLDVAKPGLVMESEISLPVEHIHSHHMSWAQWFRDSVVPGVYRNKWFEHRHMQHAIARWDNDKSPQLQTAWMNGSGKMIWENIFGQWIGWNERDKSTYRSMYSIQHYYSDLFSGDGWIPLSHESPVSGVYISSWQSQGIRLWTLINRNEFPVEGRLMKTKTQVECSYFDLVKGEELNCNIEDGMILLSGRIGSRGIGCFLEIADLKIDKDFTVFLTKQKEIFKLSSDDTTIPIKNNQLISPGETVKHSAPLEGMVEVPAASLTLNMEYTLREVGSYGNIQDHLAISARNRQFEPVKITKKAEITRFAIDKTPVTNQMFKEFITSSGYEPPYSVNFLRHWTNGQIPSGKEDHPVVYIDLEDARAYARWAKKRLPTEFEWQFAAQGKEALDYPWGNELEDNKYNKNTNGETTSVKAFPQGISPYGCYDMCGNTWEWTESEYSDGRTRFVMLKGGSCFKAEGSHWYMDGGIQKTGFFAKMLMMWSGLDRFGTVGFRCVVDL